MSSSSEPMVTIEELQRAIHYNHETGKMVWKISPSLGVKIGDSITCVNATGYVCVGFKGKSMLAHRVAWLLFHGRWPKKHIDHIDGNRTNNSISNLREADARLNGQNKKPHREGHLCGTTKSKTTGKWISQCRINGRLVYLGTFESQGEAHEEYCRAVALSNPKEAEP